MAGARVFVPSGGPATTTDVQGRFELAGVVPEKTFVLVERTGFRLAGRLVDPATTRDPVLLSLARTTDDPGHVIAPLPDPFPRDESRALAKSVLEPYLRRTIEKGNEFERRWPLTTLVGIDPDRVQEMLNKGQFPDQLTLTTLRGELAVQMVGKDPTDAEALIEAIPDSRSRAQFLVRLATAVPGPDAGAGKSCSIRRSCRRVRSLSFP